VGSLWLGTFVGFLITLILGFLFLGIVHLIGGLIVGGFVAGIIAWGGLLRGALAGFLAGIFGGKMAAIFAILGLVVGGLLVEFWVDFSAVWRVWQLELWQLFLPSLERLLQRLEDSLVVHSLGK